MNRVGTLVVQIFLDEVVVDSLKIQSYFNSCNQWTYFNSVQLHFVRHFSDELVQSTGVPINWFEFYGAWHDLYSYYS
uniref:Uncharacterized protein n=1 Tax=Helianthus annuus TaxID=4232 RepID=A0A251UIT1_HELAN